MKNNTIYYMMPGFTSGYEILYATFFVLKQEHPEVFYPNQEINFIYDCYPNAIWNGGSILLNNKQFYLREDIEQHIQYFNKELNIPLAFTFTNPTITEQECYDTYCNLIAELGNNGMNYIIVSSPVLESYLRNNYKNYKYCRSIINALDDISHIDNYEYTLLKRSNNRNFELLKSIPQNKRHKIEILCNDKCPIDCPRINQHYNIYAEAQKAFGVSSFDIECKFTQQEENNAAFITQQDIQNIYAPLGYNHFKISGRTDVIFTLYSIIKYFIKPEYHAEIYNVFIMRLFGLY
jgi:collagenase-like PrtC family protease